MMVLSIKTEDRKVIEAQGKYDDVSTELLNFRDASAESFLQLPLFLHFESRLFIELTDTSAFKMAAMRARHKIRAPRRVSERGVQIKLPTNYSSRDSRMPKPMTSIPYGMFFQFH